MIVQQQFLQKLKHDFSLNIYEVKIWTALLSRGIATAGELADISGVPRSRCYDVLETLEKKGFIIMKIGKPIRYIAVAPEEIVERVKKSFKEEAETDIKILESIKDTDIFRELQLLHKTGIESVNVEDISYSVAGRDEIGRFLREIVERAKKSVTIATTEQGFEQKVNWLKNAIKAVSKKGVKVKFIASINKKLADKLEGTAQLKDVKHNARFVIVDDAEVAFMITDENATPDYDKMVWVKSPFFVYALQEMFENSLRHK